MSEKLTPVPEDYRGSCQCPSCSKYRAKMRAASAPVMSTNRSEIVRAVKDIRAEPNMDAAVDLAIRHLVRSTPVSSPPPSASGEGERQERERLRSALTVLVEKWRGEAAQNDSFHATMGIGWKACANALESALASASSGDAGTGAERSGLDSTKGKCWNCGVYTRESDADAEQEPQIGKPWSLEQVADMRAIAEEMDIKSARKRLEKYGYTVTRPASLER